MTSLLPFGGRGTGSEHLFGTQYPNLKKVTPFCFICKCDLTSTFYINIFLEIIFLPTKQALQHTKIVIVV
jgi:hypothetical protein